MKNVKDDKLRGRLLRSAAAIALSLMSGLGHAQESGQLDGVPTIRVDNEHWQTERSDGSQPLRYQVPAADRIILDAAGYQFSIPAFLGRGSPTMIMVSTGKDRQYGIAWKPGETRYTFSSETLHPLAGSQPFRGFRAGQEIVVMIGHVDLSAHATSDSTFFTFWSALVDIL